MAGWDAALSAVPRSEAAVRHTRGIRPDDRVPEEAREAGMTGYHPLGEEIQDFADGRLTPARREDLEAHVARCASRSSRRAGVSRPSAKSWISSPSGWYPVIPASRASSGTLSSGRIPLVWRTAASE